MTNKFVKLDKWAKELIVDPLSKDPLTMSEDNNYLLSSYGRKYPVVSGIYSLRVLNNETTKDQKVWKQGQRHFEKWSQNLAEHDKTQNYFAEIEGVKEVYEDIPLEGSCLDVGGHHGRLRHFITLGQKYISCDPSLTGFDDIDKQPNLLKAYPFLAEPCNFICCDAELLPFRSCSFQTVHMRSVIDHFLNPELALNEAYRVLNFDGILIVGLYVRGGKLGKIDMKACLEELTKGLLSSLGFERFKDSHVWHPTYNELLKLISDGGFKIEKVHWQKGYNNTVCYIRARKQSSLEKRKER
jgi:ubiquinone/menaquinone biosynthesis C-methylase UbiE